MERGVEHGRAHEAQGRYRHGRVDTRRIWRTEGPQAAAQSPDGNGSGGGGFSLQINIAPGHATTINARQVQQDIDDAVVEDVPVKRRVIRTDAPALSAIPEEVKEVFEFEDDSALFN